MNLQTQEDGVRYQHVLRKENRMYKEDIIRILNLISEQTKADGCEGCEFIKTNER